MKRVCRDSWWVVLFLIFCYYCYEQGMAKKNSSLAGLQSQFHHLQNEERSALLLQQELVKQLDSRSDPEWVEMVLMQRLGLAPEGHIKVLFTATAHNVEVR